MKITTGLSNNHKELEHSNFGKYTIKDSLILTLPYTCISFKRESEKKFLYDRIDSQESTCSKIITTKHDNPEILLTPIAPNHQPSTEADHIFLKFDREITMENNSKTKFSLNCPIEIGIYLINEGEPVLLDSCTCESMHSRFGIYGDHPEGILCKYMEISTKEIIDNAKPFVYAKMSLTIVNKTNTQVSLNKIIIPVQNLRLFFDKQFAATNKINCVIKNTTVTKETVADINSSNESSQNGWSEAKVGRQRKNIPFLMDKGLV